MTILSSVRSLIRLLLCTCLWSTCCALQAGQIVSNYTQQCAGLPSTSLSDGNPVALWTCDGSANQQWLFEPVGYVFRVIASGSGKCLTIQNGSNATGALAIQQTCQDFPYQLWHVTGSGNNRQIRPTHTSMCLNFIANIAVNGTSLVQLLCIDAPGEKWRIDASPVVTPTLPSFWHGPLQLPLSPASAAILPNGKVLLWSAYATMDYNGKGQTYVSTFDPIKLTASVGLVKNTKHDMFCPGTVQLADGRIMVTGGSDSDATSIYDPSTNLWSIGPKMVISRGYHAMTLLSDGSVFTMGGSWSGGYGNKSGEVWNVTTGVWSVRPNLRDDSFLTNDAAGIYRSDNHMWFLQAPNGLIFHAGPSKQMHWINVTGSGTIVPSVWRGDDLDAMNGNAVMYDIGKILTLGGATSYETSFARAGAYVIDINGAEAKVQRVGNMTYQRAFANSVVLPNGEVVVIGGTAWAMIFSDLNMVRAAEIWSPVTQNFSLLTEMAIPRNYHSVAVLLQDGRVLAAGGGLCGNCTANHPDTEMLTPPYLLNADGSLATRPVIAAAPTTIIPGASINVTMGSVASYTFSLVRTSVITHSVNNDQRRIPLQATQTRNSSNYTLLIPANPNVVLAGHYFLFAMNPNGVPSVAQIVSRQLNASPEKTSVPTSTPTKTPTLRPSTSSPTRSPTVSLTPLPTSLPTNLPTIQPSQTPSTAPTLAPTSHPTSSPSAAPSSTPSAAPTPAPTSRPTSSPSAAPSAAPTGNPTRQPPPPMTPPSASPSHKPSLMRTKRPTNSPTPALRVVTSFTLINANTSEALFPLTNGTTVSLSKLSNVHVNIQADIIGPIQSVRFEFAGQNITRNRPAPYLLMNPFWIPKVGSFALKATPYSLMKGNGAAGVTLTIDFGVDA